MHLLIYSDGASRGNPGPAAIGVVIKDLEQNTIATLSECIGVATNNIAEYWAVLASLKEAYVLKADRVTLFTDSELLSRQLTGKYCVKSRSIMPYYLEVVKIAGQFKSFSVKHINRELNVEADLLANKALDNKFR